MPGCGLRLALTYQANPRRVVATDCQEAATMARISYVEPDTITDPGLAAILEESRTYGTPRLESQAIRAHVPAVLRTFAASWQQVFREGVLDHRIKELARVYVAKSLECGYCAGQRSHIAAEQGATEDDYDDIIDFR